MKLKAPHGCYAASHEGHSIPIAIDRTIDVDEQTALVFIAHGFRPLMDRGATPSIGSLPPGSESITLSVGLDDIEGLNRRALFAYLRKLGVSVSLPITKKELRAAARRARGR